MALKTKPIPDEKERINFITHPDQINTGIVFIISNVLDNYDSIKKTIETLNKLKVFDQPVYIIDYGALTEEQMDKISELGYGISRPFILLKRNGNEIYRSRVEIDDNLFESLKKNGFVSISKEQEEAIRQFLFEFKPPDRFSNKMWYIITKNFQDLCEVPFSEITKLVALVAAEKIMSVRDDSNRELLVRALLNTSEQSENTKTITIWTIGALLQQGFPPSNFPNGESALWKFLTEPLIGENENAKFAALWSLLFFLDNEKVNLNKIKRDDKMVENIAHTLDDFISSKDYNKMLLGVIAFRVFVSRFGIGEEGETTINKICDLLADLKEIELNEGEKLKIQELKKQISSTLGAVCLSFKIDEKSDTGKNIIDSFVTLLKDEDEEVANSALAMLAQVANTELNRDILQSEEIKEALDYLGIKDSNLFVYKKSPKRGSK